MFCFVVWNNSASRFCVSQTVSFSASGPREAFSERLSRFRDQGKIPANITTVIRFLNNMRNSVVYQGCRPGQAEFGLIDSAWKIVRDRGEGSVN